MALYANHNHESFICGVQYHPSTRAAGMEGLDEWDITAKVTVPQLIFAAENDVDEYKPGGKTIESLATTAPGSVCLPVIPGTAHGWVSRGDISDADVKAAVEQAINQ